MSLIDSLYNYGVNHSLQDAAYFEENEIEWFLCVGADESLTLLRKHGPRGDRGQPFHLPIPLKRSSNILPNFPADFPVYVLGLDAPGENKRKRRQKDWPQRCHKAYLEQIELAAKETGDPSLGLFCAALRRRFPNLALDPKINGVGVTANDLICPAVMKDGIWTPISEIPSIREWWVTNYPRIQKMWGRIGTCSVMGAKNVRLARIHPLVTGIRGGKSTGVTLVTFNQPSTWSFGATYGQNGSISVDVAILAAKALSRICSQKSGKRRAVEIAKGLHLGFVPQKKDEEEAAEFVLSLLDPVEKDFTTEPEENDFPRREVRVWRAHRNLFGDPRRGLASPIHETPVDFFIIRVRESSSRVEILQHEIGTFGELAGHLRAYFADLETWDSWTNKVRSDFPTKTIWPPHDNGAKDRRPVAQGLLNSLRPKPKDQIPRPEIAVAFYLSALFGKPVPPEILGLSVAAAARAARKGRGIPAEVSALMKISLNRELRRPGSQLRTRWELLDNRFLGVQPMLDCACMLVSYLLGRILAIAERIQGIAIPNVNSSVIKRCYDGTMRSPASMMPTILSDLNHHIEKIRRAKPGLHVWCHKLIQEVLDKLPADKEKAFPKMLDLPDQCLFNLGYAHQRGELFRKKKEELEPAGKP
jgi:CRISPR-associated protein Csd1